FPGSREFPWRELLKKGYWPDCWTSSAAWILGLAMEQPGIKKIGLWGLDLSTPNEYKDQRPGVKYLIWEATKKGIEVLSPVESDILQPAPLYGFKEQDPMYWVLRARRELFEASQKEAREVKAQA